MDDWLAQMVLHLVPAIQAVGVVIVLWGVVEAIVDLVRLGWRRTIASAPQHLGDLRIRMGSKMVLALEFFIAGDIIQTVMVPTWQSLAILAGIVTIRTVIAYFLQYEMRVGAHDQ